MDINQHITRLLNPNHPFTAKDIKVLLGYHDPELLKKLSYACNSSNYSSYFRVLELFRASQDFCSHLLTVMVSSPELDSDSSSILHTMIPFMDQSTIERLFILLYRDGLTWSAAHALAYINDSAIVDRLLEDMAHGSLLQPLQAAMALAYCHDVRALPVLLDGLFNDDWLARKFACNGLGFLADTAAVEPLARAAIIDEDWSVRDAAVQALGSIGGLQVVDTLIDALQDPEEFVRVTAANQLGALQYPQAVDALAHAILTDENDSVKASAIDALKEIESSRAVEPLIAALSDENPDVRAAAAGALETFDDPRSFAPLIRAMGDPDKHVRYIAADSLSEMPSFHTDDPAVVEKIHLLLRECYGHNP
ncbi:MAG: HEAT repeat domain-containing protein [Armatimonadota bacterium]